MPVTCGSSNPNTQEALVWWFLTAWNPIIPPATSFTSHYGFVPFSSGETTSKGTRMEFFQRESWHSMNSAKQNRRSGEIPWKCRIWVTWAQDGLDVLGLWGSIASQESQQVGGDNLHFERRMLCTRRETPETKKDDTAAWKQKRENQNSETLMYMT